jgi:hypothetical protein
LKRLLFFLSVTVSIVSAQSLASPKMSLRALFVEDQRDRGVALSDDGTTKLSEADAAKMPQRDWPEITKRDTARRASAKEIIANSGATTGEDFYYAAFLYQHSESSDDYLLAHVFATEAIALGYTKAKGISAATLDRYLQSIGQKQVFGTQYSDEKYAYYLQHRNDPDMKEKIKNIEGGQTLQPYNENLVPDKIRNDFCVPSLALQQQHISNVIAGKENPGDLPRVKNCGH